MSLIELVFASGESELTFDCFARISNISGVIGSFQTNPSKTKNVATFTVGSTIEC